MKLVHKTDKKHPLIGGGGRRRMGSHTPCPLGCPVAGQPLEEEFPVRQVLLQRGTPMCQVSLAVRRCWLVGKGIRACEAEAQLRIFAHPPAFEHRLLAAEGKSLGRRGSYIKLSVHLECSLLPQIKRFNVRRNSLEIKSS